MDSSSNTSLPSLRFVDEGICSISTGIPFEKYKEKELVSIEKAVEPLIGIVLDVENSVSTVKIRCLNPDNGLTTDESAAIMLYTYESVPRENSLYYILNQTLRSQQHDKLEFWSLYLRLFFHALDRLEPVRRHVYRGVCVDLSSHYPAYEISKCWSFMSCTSNIEALKQSPFLALGEKRTFMEVDCISGRDIRNHSYWPNENEVLILPNTEFIIKGHLCPVEHFYMIQLQEVDKSPVIHQIKDFCTIHNKNETNHWCHDHQTLVCNDCISLNSGKHSFCTVTHLSDSTSKALTDRADSLRKKIRSQREKLDVDIFNFKQQEISVKTQFDQLRTLVDQHEKRILSKIRDLEEKNNTRIDQHLCFLATLENNLEKETTSFTTLIKNNDPMIMAQKLVRFDKSIKSLDENFEEKILPALFYSSVDGINQVCEDIDERLRSICLHRRPDIPNLPEDVQWKLHGTTHIEQLKSPWGITMDHRSGTVYVAEFANHCVRAWKHNDDVGKLVAGNYESGDGLHQLKSPTDILLGQEKNSILICDTGNRRVMRWSLESNTKNGEIVIDNIVCGGIAMDDDESLYVTDAKNHEVRKYLKNSRTPILIAGGHGRGDALNQLNTPFSIAVDTNGAVYISDWLNHRVVRWEPNAKEGFLIAGGLNEDSLHLRHPTGVLVDSKRNVYIVESTNNRVTRWSSGKNRGELILGSKIGGNGLNQLEWPVSLVLDALGNFYVTDLINGRVQYFSVL